MRGGLSRPRTVSVDRACFPDSRLAPIPSDDNKFGSIIQRAVTPKNMTRASRAQR